MADTNLRERPVLRRIGIVVGTTALVSLVGVGVFAAPPAGHFVDTGNGAVIDTHARLTWQQTEPGGTYTQAQAVTYCDSLVLAGYSDWRLPTVAELQMILDETRINPAIDTTFFPGATPTVFWSSTSSAAAAGNGWFVSFYEGYTDDGDLPSTPHHARCVR